jgi:hypothetical protein
VASLSLLSLLKLKNVFVKSLKAKQSNMSSLKLWVSDALHEVANISDRTIADFFIDLASKSSSPDDLVSNSH